jgi:hypothetical protein
LSELQLALGLVDCRVRPRVYDDVRSRLAHALRDLIGIGEVEALPVEHRELAERRERAPKLPADLAVRPGEGDPHG